MVSTDYRLATTEADWHEPVHWYATRSRHRHAGVGVVDVASRKLLTIVKLGDQETADFHGILIPATQQ
jgi:hypothetical protein